ncbi:hypothetical protein [Novosphingobium rosa]|uniref:hypothetical protein n=1 Tax=Novosphingobium rosa TaxID=76978 RepID=UPI000832352C|nr:hypothetical protein [Novosphingobium rosa]
MADASFTRCPSAAMLDDAQAGALLGSGGWPLRSVIEPFDAARYAPPEIGPQPAPPGAAHYELDLASDTGPYNGQWGIIMLVAFNAPDDVTPELERWYEQEHIDLLMRAPGWLRARRYRVKSHSGGPAWTSMAFHELADMSVMESPERAFARSTPWRAELEKGAWFQSAGRGVFRALA